MFGFLRRTKQVPQATFSTKACRTLRLEMLEDRVVPAIRTYQETAIASGSLGSVPFSNARIELVSTADTANIQTSSALGTTYYRVPNSNLTITVAGVGTATFTDQTYTTTYPFNQAGFWSPRTGFPLLTYNTVLATYDLRGDIGPVVGTGDPFREGVHPTTLGNLQLTSVAPGLTFQSPSVTNTDIAMLSAQLQSGNTVQFTYQTTGNPGPFAVSVYRSADPIFDPSDSLVATTLVTTPSAPGGSPATIALGSELPIDPRRRHVLVVADPTRGITETDEGNNTSSFRKLALGAVTHGYQPLGQMPGWVTAMAAELRLDGYADAIPFDWALRSALPFPNMATSAGVDLALRVRTLAAQLATQSTDVIDVHFIGHSRGSVVISQALLSLQNNPGPINLQLGYYTMTMLDPHPARNRGSLIQGLLELNNGTGVSTVGGFSFNQFSPISRDLARTTLLFQAAMNDPEVVIARNVDDAEIYRQQIPWYAQQSLSDVLLGFNLWAAPPTAILNPFSRPVFVSDVGRFGIGHTGVAEWYLNFILIPR